MRKKIIIGNWKMFKNTQESLNFLEKLNVHSSSNLVYGIAAPFTNLATLTDSNHLNSNMMIGAQNCHHESYGAYTGEISVDMLLDFNIDFCLVGHSERRKYFNENDTTINLKIRKLLANNISPILCVGETLEEFESGITMSVIKDQLNDALVDVDDLTNIVIAYEPVWAIGTGQSASEEIAQKICKFIRDHLAVRYGHEMANSLLIQYGGSVTNENIVAYLSQPDVDGALIGSASLDAEKFSEILNNF